MLKKSINKIIIPTDLSDLSAAAISYVRSYEIFASATIFVLHTIEMTPIATFPPVEFTSDQFLRDAQEEADRDLAEYFRQSVPADMKAVAVIRHGEPYREITRFAQEENADLIVIATHGRTGLSHILLGSVAEKVVRHSTVPVLTIKPQEMRDSLLHSTEVEEQLHIQESRTPGQGR